MFAKKKYSLIFILLIACTCIMFICDLFIGSVYISAVDIWRVIIGHSDNETYNIIILQSRLPKALTALMAGLSLPVGGLMMQTFFKNPLAGPDMLGISSGASLFVAIVLMGSGFIGISPMLYNNFSIIVAAIVGAVLVLLLVLVIADTLRDSVSLLIFGLMLGTTIGAIVSIFQYFSEKQALKNYVLWTFGNLTSVTWSQLHYLIPVTITAVSISFFLAKWLNGLLLGEVYAQSMGMPLRKAKISIICITGILTGSITAYCGPIVFIGIAVPHIARMLFKTTNHFILLPACMLAGMSIMLLCDIISQLPGQEIVLPINSITALMGAPFVIYIIIKNYKLTTYF